MIANIIVIDYAFTLDRRLRLILTGPVVSLCPGWENVDSIDDGEDGGRWDGDDTNDDQDRCAPAQLHPDRRTWRRRCRFRPTSGDTFFLPFQVLFISLVNILLVEEISQHLKTFLTLTTVTLLSPFLII